MKSLLTGAVAPQPWRNGGGQTRELITWPPGAEAQGWQLRLSVADITQDGLFSAFDGVERWFAVLSGAGVALTLDGDSQRLTPDSEPLVFDGAAAPACKLLDGPTRDLNLMLRGVRGSLLRALAGQPWDPAWPWCAVFSAGGARLRDGAGVVHDLPAMSLTTGLPAGLMSLEPQGGPSYWIGADLRP